MSSTSGNVMSAEDVREYFGGISNDLLGRYVAAGLPCFWTGGHPGTGKRLFHRGQVDEWVAAQAEAMAKKSGEQPTSQRGKAAARGKKGKDKAAGPVRTARGYEGF